MTALEKIEHIKKVRGLKRNSDGVFEVDMAIEFLLRAFNVMRKIIIAGYLDGTYVGSEEGAREYLEEQFEELMKESAPK